MIGNQTIRNFTNKILYRVDGHRYKKQLREYVGCPACKYYFDDYETEKCACSKLEIIDYMHGCRLNYWIEHCDSFRFNGRHSWLDYLMEVMEEDNE